MLDFCIKILRDLVSFKTITPHGADAIEYCSNFLESLGFSCQKLQYGEVSNMYARFGNSKKNLCFAGHVDIVPPQNDWVNDPFTLVEKGEKLYGRGVNDMKGPLAAFLVALKNFPLNSSDLSISVLLTSNEEISGENGTKEVIKFLKEKNEVITGAVLCESCSPYSAGEYIKIGCKGSLNIDLISSGKQCHVVNGKVFGNHIHNFVKTLYDLTTLEFDKGNENFSSSDLEITSIDIENPTRNLIPNNAIAKLNIRFNNLWTFEKLEELIKKKANGLNVLFKRFENPFVCANQNFIDFLKNVIKETIWKEPQIGTLGGNSDASFIKDITDVVEIGSRISEAHIANEFITKEDLMKLMNIYSSIMNSFNKYT
ncbi:MAG: succinyl-diaminopimelate desuccinylase [Holosporales bacterium]|jgi:succinyl-diaminopimelate desuccinylase|nr:succinyl-diaminopimelate desuccinylase [Holosporales bacterium]